MKPARALSGLVMLLHYWLPVAVGGSLALAMSRWTGRPLSCAGMVLLLSGIGAAYSADRPIDPSTRRPQPRWVTFALALGGVVFTGMGIGAAARMPWQASAVAALLAMASLFYSRLKRYPLAKTGVVALVWTSALTLFPLVGGEQLAWSGFPFFLPLFLIIAAGCLLSDLKDSGEDRQRAIPSLPALLGNRATCQAAALLALAAGFIAHGDEIVPLTAVAVAMAAFAPHLLARNPLVVDALFLIPGVLIVTGLV